MFKAKIFRSRVTSCWVHGLVWYITFSLTWFNCLLLHPPPPTCKNPKISEVMVIVKKLKPTNQPKKPTPLPPRQKKPQPSNQNQPIKQNPRASNHPATKAKQNTSVRDSSVRNNFNVPYTGESRKKINEVWPKSCSQSDSLLTYPNHLRAQEIFLLRR